MNKQVYIHTAFTILAAKKFVEPLALSLDFNKYDVELWIDPFEGYFNNKAIFGLPVKYVDMHLTLNFIKSLLKIFKIYTELKQVRPIVIETHFTMGSFLPLMAAKVAGIKRRIYHNHGIPFVGYQGIMKWALYIIEQLNCLLATEVITVSKGMLKIYSNMFYVNPKIGLADPGSACGLPDNYYIDLESMPLIKKTAREKNGFSNDTIFIFVGRAVERKGLLIVIQAFEAYYEQFKNSTLLLAGCTTDDLLKREISHPKIIALGFVDDICTYYEMSDVVLLPSMHEGFGYSLLEGAAMGNALISSDILGPDDLVLNGITGYRVKVKCIHSLKDAMIKITKNREILSKIQYSARVHAEKYRRDIVIKNYLKIVE